MVLREQDIVQRGMEDLRHRMKALDKELENIALQMETLLEEKQ